MLLIIITGCGKHADFTIQGKLAGSAKDSLVLEEMTEKAMGYRCSIKTGSDGSFSYSDTAANPRLLFLRSDQNEYIMLMVLKGDHITLSAEKGRIEETLKMTGSVQSGLILELNKALRRATLTLDSLEQQYQNLKGRGNDPQLDYWLQGEYGKLMEQQRNFIRAFILQHVSEPASLIALSHKVGRQPVLNGSADFDLYEKVDAELFRKYPQSMLVLHLHRYVANMRNQLQAAESHENKLKNGTLAPDIALPDPSGQTKKLSALRGKIVLLDFWAGWCAPCRRENPNLVKVYQKYHDKGFEIYQVSLDKSKPSWQEAIKQDRLNWIQVSDLKFWGSPVVQLYGIESIPSNFLLDRNGKIIAQNLRGAELDEKLDQLFK